MKKIILMMFLIANCGKLINNLKMKEKNINDLIVAIKDNKEDKIIELLKGKNVNVNVKNKEGQFPLIYAINEKKEGILKLLLSHGADVNVKDNDGNTALILAAKQNNEDILNLLLENDSIDLDIEDKEGDTALICAYKEKNLKLIRIFLERYDSKLKNVQLERLLLNTIKDRETIFSSYLFDECTNFQNRLVNMNINYKDEKGNTAFHYTARLDEVFLINALIRNRGDINMKNNAGETPLFFAINRSSINEYIVGHLINKGAKIPKNLNIDGKSLVEHLSSYPKICDTLVYDPIIKKFIGDEKHPSSSIESLKKIIKDLQLNDIEKSIFFLRDLLLKSYSNYSVKLEGLNVVKDEEESNLEEVDLSDLSMLFQKIEKEDFSNNTQKNIDKNNDLDRFKKVLFEDLNKIKEVENIELKFDPTSEEIDNYMDFLTKKKLLKLIFLIQLIDKEGENGEEVKLALRDMLEYILIKDDHLGGINKALKFLKGTDQRKGKDIKKLINECLLALRHEILIEVLKEKKKDKKIMVDIKGKRYSPEITEYLIHHVISSLGESVKIRNNNISNNFNYIYNREEIESEVESKYKDRIIDYVNNIINGDNDNIRKKVINYMEENMFEGKSLMNIKEFRDPKEDKKIKIQVIPALLAHFGFLKVN